MATREEAEQLAKLLRQRWPRIIFGIEEDWDSGEYYISVISDPGVTPDLAPAVPADWHVFEWRIPDQRFHVTSIRKLL